MVVAPSAAAGDSGSYVDWGAIIGGAALAAAIALLLLAFGSAVGLSFASPYRQPDDKSLWLFAIMAALWLIWVQASAFMAGGYLAGRLRRRHWDAREHEVEVRDGAHGLIVWAVGTLIAILVAGAIGNGMVRLAGSAADIAATATSGDARAGDVTGYVVDSLFRVPAPTGAAGGSAPGPGASPGSDAPTVVGSAPPAAPRVSADAATAVASRAEVTRILVVSAVRGDISAGDQAYIARVVSERTGMSQAEAQRRVNETLADARAKAKAAADKARKIAVISTFITVTSLLIGAAAAWWAASMGGRDRDAGTVFTLFGRWGYTRR